MNRRELFRSVASAAGGAGVFATGHDSSWTSIAERRTQRKASPASFIEARDGTPLFYRDWGSGNAVVFLHSWAVHSDIWQYQMVHLASKGFRCVTYDRRGHGRSGDPGRGYDFDTLADDLNTVVEQLELRRIILVGHSMGCGEIIRYLTRRGSERATRVLLVAPTLPFLLKTDDNPEGIDGRVFESLRSSWKKDFPAWLVENTRRFFETDTSQAMLDWGVRMCLETSLQGVIECNRSNTETDFRSELKTTKVPTLIVHGDADVFAPLALTGRRTAQLIPGSHLKVYEGAPHGLMCTNVDRLNAELHQFVSLS